MPAIGNEHISSWKKTTWNWCALPAGRPLPLASRLVVCPCSYSPGRCHPGGAVRLVFSGTIQMIAQDRKNKNKMDFTVIGPYTIFCKVYFTSFSRHMLYNKNRPMNLENKKKPPAFHTGGNGEG